MTILQDVFWLIRGALSELFAPPYRFKELFKQLNFIAVESLPVILICVSFAAMVTILESSFHMKLVIQNDSMVPGFAAMLILRELGAVVTGLLLTSRIGAGMAAEIGSMKITEQIEALEMLGIRPIHFLLIPRLIASCLGTMALVAIANIVCLLVAQMVTEAFLGYTASQFATAMRRFVDFQDFVFAMIKGAAFGIVIPLVACFYGFRCQPGAEGVGRATTSSVVTASILIIMIDFILSFIFSFFY